MSEKFSGRFSPEKRDSVRDDDEDDDFDFADEDLLDFEDDGEPSDAPPRGMVMAGG